MYDQLGLLCLPKSRRQDVQLGTKFQLSDSMFGFNKDVRATLLFRNFCRLFFFRNGEFLDFRDLFSPRSGEWEKGDSLYCVLLSPDWGVYACLCTLVLFNGIFFFFFTIASWEVSMRSMYIHSSCLVFKFLEIERNSIKTHQSSQEGNSVLSTRVSESVSAAPSHYFPKPTPAFALTIANRNSSLSTYPAHPAVHFSIHPSWSTCLMRLIPRHTPSSWRSFECFIGATKQSYSCKTRSRMRTLLPDRTRLAITMVYCSSGNSQPVQPRFTPQFFPGILTMR